MGRRVSNGPADIELFCGELGYLVNGHHLNQSTGRDSG